jgi:hypothetical protein
MKHHPGVTIYEDNLVKRWQDESGEILSQGKRVSKEFPLAKCIIRAYVKKGSVAAVKMIREGYQLSIVESLAILNKARGPQHHFNKYFT